MSDPDVFMLSDVANKLTDQQKMTLFILNNALGSLIMTSDSVQRYSKRQQKLLKSIFPKKFVKINDIQIVEEVYQIDCSIGKWQYLILTNLSDTNHTKTLPKGEYFYNGGLIDGGRMIDLLAYETILYKKIKSDELIIGTSGHLFPCSEIEQIKQVGSRLFIEVHSQAMNHEFFYTRNPLEIYIKQEKLNMIWGLDGLYQYEIRR